MPKEAERNAYKEQILARCYELFAREGYAAVTLRRLSKELGVSTGALYHYFSSKEELFEQTVAYIARTELARAVAEVTSKHTRKERLESLTNFLVARDEALRNLLLLIFDLTRHNDDFVQSGLVDQALEIYVEAIVAHLPEIPRKDARFAVDMLLGAIVRRLIVQRDDDFYAHIQWLVDLTDDDSSKR